MAHWIARNSDGMWMIGTAGDPSLILTQPASYTDIDVPGTRTPDPRLERGDVVNKVSRAATAPEITAFDDAQTDSRSQMTSRQRDILATCALVVRARDIPGWNAMTTPQKVSAAYAEADVWKALRIFAEKNL